MAQWILFQLLRSDFFRVGQGLSLPSQQTIIDLKADNFSSNPSIKPSSIRQTSILEEKENIDSKTKLPSGLGQPAQSPAKVSLSYFSLFYLCHSIHKFNYFLSYFSLFCLPNSS